MNEDQPPGIPDRRRRTPEDVVGHALLVLRGFPPDGVEQARNDAALVVGALRTCGMLTDDRVALDRAEAKAAQWREAYEAAVARNGPAVTRLDDGRSGDDAERPST